MLGSLGWEELLVILAIVALISGASRVADLGGALGRGVREFREGVRGDAELESDGAATPATEGDEADAPSETSEVATDNAASMPRE